MLLVQEFLEKYTFKDLQEQHGVYASFSKSGHKFSLNYDQIEAKESDPLSQECRGLILASVDGKSFIDDAAVVNGKLSYDHISPGKTTVLAYPMKRFFNHGQGSAAQIDFMDPNLSVLEKMDGTLCIVYFDWFTKKWCVATRSVPEADLLMDNGIFTFRTLFEKALFDTTGLSFDEYTDKLEKEMTYCFELTTPYNRIVVYYPDNRITLLSARHVVYATEAIIGGKSWSSFYEIDLKDVNSHGVPKVQAHAYTSISELLDWVSSLNPMEHEGVVIRDAKFNRIKVKNAAYVAYNRVRDNLASSPRNCVEIILQEKDDDVIAFLPEEIGNNLKDIKVRLNKAIKHHDEAYQLAISEANKIAPGDKKTFAILITKNKELWSAPFFKMFDGKASSMRDFIQKNKIEGTWSNSLLDKLLDISKQY